MHRHLQAVLAAGVAALLAAACTPSVDQAAVASAAAKPEPVVAARAPEDARADGAGEEAGLSASIPAVPVTEPALPVESQQEPPGQASGMWRVTTAPGADELAPGESMFVEDGQISAFRLRDEMRSERWDDTVAGFEADALADGDARELQALYERTLHASLDEHGLTLVRLGCGVSLCAGTVRGPKNGGQSRLEHWWTSRPAGELPMPFLVKADIDSPHYVESRFSFSTDPSIRGIVIKPAP